ncbi:unnamed protein product [Sphagnum troendelagicum]
MNTRCKVNGVKIGTNFAKSIDVISRVSFFTSRTKPHTGTSGSVQPRRKRPSDPKDAPRYLLTAEGEHKGLFVRNPMSKHDGLVAH